MGSLHLTRKRHESIMIGDNIKVTVDRIKNGYVRLKFAAPEEIAIHREEIYVQIQVEKNSQNSEQDVLTQQTGSDTI